MNEFVQLIRRRRTCPFTSSQVNTQQSTVGHPSPSAVLQCNVLPVPALSLSVLCGGVHVLITYRYLQQQRRWRQQRCRVALSIISTTALTERKSTIANLSRPVHTGYGCRVYHTVKLGLCADVFDLWFWTRRTSVTSSTHQLRRRCRMSRLRLTACFHCVYCQSQYNTRPSMQSSTFFEWQDYCKVRTV